MVDTLAELLPQTYPQFKDRPLTLVPFGEGLIHQTYLVRQGEKQWILQGFNETVFTYPQRIEHNLALLSERVRLRPLPFTLPLPLSNGLGKGLTHIEGKKYRLFEFVEGKTLQGISSPAQARMAAQAYGTFASWAQELPVEAFQETIPNFHRLDLRFARLQEVASTSSKLSEEVERLLHLYLKQAPLVTWYTEQLPILPQRVTHNDTKINNLIFSSDLKQVAAVVDLDTLMGGYLLYDLGDLVRTVACSLPETSTQWPLVRALPEVVKALILGYWEGLSGAITPQETASLPYAGEVMTLIMGLRFLTDYLEGNVYYRVTYEDQNLHRAKNQMALLHSLQSQREHFQHTIEKLSPRVR
ncbi:MAG: phosphotransferase enzyme family protein [Bacteroidota bacterium]|jgi:Ser/Thr protein kinase RdoA (MazF antagonist)|nr:aminoglycoside phosphotransferase family protein [Algoriphagus sp.]